MTQTGLPVINSPVAKPVFAAHIPKPEELLSDLGQKSYEIQEDLSIEPFRQLPL